MKEQGSAALRIVAFAVALAVVLGLASVMFQVTASAEDATSVSSDNIPTSVTGTFGNYSAVKFTASNQIFDPSTVFTDYDKKSYIGVFAYEKDGKLVIYDDLYSYLNNGVIFFEFANCSFSGNDDSLFYILKTDKYKDSVSEQAAYFNNYVMLYHSKSDFNYSDLSQNLPLNMFPSRIITFDGFTDLYMIYTTAGSILTESECKSKIADMTSDVNKMSITQWQGSDSNSSPSAKFITCASFTNADGSFPLWVKDFIAEGHQYPMFTFAISDNGNNHKYSMVLSYNDNDLIAPFIVGMYDELSDPDKRTGFKLTTAISKKFHVPGFVGITNMSDVLKKGCINIFEKNWVNLTYNRAFNLNSSDLDFTENTGNKVYTITLSDYSAIKANTFYKAELIDLTTSEVLDVTYFTSAQSFNKSDSGNGTKIYDYGDKSDQMWDDLKNNTPSVDPSKGDNFNVGGDVDTNFDNLSNLNINDIISGLRTSISSVSVFFQACWSLFPAAFWSIILLGVSLIIILRILGR